MNLQSAMAYIDSRSVLDKKTGCLNWLGSCTKGGYGTVNNQGNKTTVHRFIYWLYHGHINASHEVHHRCKNTRCINLDHIQSLNRFKHAELCSKAMQTHCIHGHEFTKENTYYKVSNGTRVCRECAANRQRELRKSKWKQ
jgi:hypothetical protein